MNRLVTSFAALATCTVLGCGAEYEQWSGNESSPAPLGSAEGAVAQCDGDDLQYDFNAFAASLAVAIADELGRWDVLTDFDLVNGRLSLSNTGRGQCDGGSCENVEAILALQEDSSGSIPYHSPSLFRQKLSGWYQEQERVLVELSTAGQQAEGVFRIVSTYSNKRMSVDYGSTSNGARIELQGWTTHSGTDEWELRVSGTGHNFVNVRSGKCMDSTWSGVKQNDCNGASSQLFELVEVASGVGIWDHNGRALAVYGWQTGNDVPVSAEQWYQHNSNLIWRMESVSGAASASSSGVTSGMYALMLKHSGKALSASSSGDVVQRSYQSGNGYSEWYASAVGDQYQFVNRHSGKCLRFDGGFSSNQVDTADCANVASQMFDLVSTNDGQQYFGLRGNYGKVLQVPDYSFSEGKPLVASSGSVDWDSELFRFDDILAGERHELTFSHVTNDGPCGDYYWYEISQPNGLPLAAPEETFVQLIFAGGKRSLNGADDNPFIAQQTSGTLVAIDPTSYLVSSTSGTSGSCVDSDIVFDSTRQSAGKCCIRYNGQYGTFRQSSWSSTTFLCQ